MVQSALSLKGPARLQRSPIHFCLSMSPWYDCINGLFRGTHSLPVGDKQFLQMNHLPRQNEKIIEPLK